MQPIPLGEFSGELRDSPGNEANDSDLLDGRLGIHNVCGGEVLAWSCSVFDRVIKCEKCHFLRIVSQDIKTMGDLRAWFERHQK